MNADVRLETLAVLAEEFEWPTLRGRIQELRARMTYQRRHLVFTGEFNRGKTTLINALLGKPLLPMGITPTTALLWQIEVGEEQAAHLVYPGGRKQQLASENSGFETLSAAGDSWDSSIRYVAVTVPGHLFGADTVIVDTPGVNDINQQRAEVTYGYLEAADIVVFLLDATTPVTRSEADFLKLQLLRSTADKTVFVLNKTSRLDAEEREESREIAEERLEEVLGTRRSVIAIDALEILKGTSTEDRRHGDRWGLSQLLESIAAKLETLSAPDDLVRHRELQIQALEESIRNRLVRRLEDLQRSDVEARAEAVRLEELLAESEQRFTDFLTYVDVQGLEPLKLMSARSFQKGREDLVDRLRVQVVSLVGNVSQFVEALPPRVQLFTKEWFERRRLGLERFLDRFTRHVALEYGRTFGGRARVSPSMSTAPVTNTSAEATLTLKEINDVVMLGLPAAGYLSTALLLGTGPFAFVGIAGGALIGRWLKRRRLETLKRELEVALPSLVQEMTRHFSQSLDDGVTRWFEALKTGLRRQFLVDCQQAQRRIEELRTEKGPDRAAAIERVEDALLCLPHSIP